MFKTIKLAFAKRRLQHAIQHEADCRTAADHARDVLIPALQAEVRELEATEFFRSIHGGRPYQWAGRNGDRLPLDGRVSPLEGL